MYRSVFTVEVMSDRPYSAGADLTQIAHDIEDGDAIDSHMLASSEVVPAGRSAPT
jgi:hypothetical protein